MGKYQGYEKYKDSGVEWLGEIPEHWEVWRFNHFAPIITCGVAATPEYCDDGVVFLSAQNVKQNSINLDVGYKYISRQKHKELTKYRKPINGDILLSRVGTIGEACVVDVSYEFSIFVSLTHIRVLKNICYNKFLIFYFGSSLAQALYKTTTLVGGGVGNLNVNDLKEYQIPLPPLNEQQSIARFLDHKTKQIDDLIAKKETLIKKLDEKRTALISHAVTKGLDPNVPMKDSRIEWLGEIPKHWEVMHLKRKAQVRGGVAKGRKLDKEETLELPYLRVANVQDGYIDISDISYIEVLHNEIERYSLHDGDVLMNEGGDNDKLGRGAVWKAEINPCLHQNHVFSVRPNNKKLSSWIALLTSSPYAKFYFFTRAKQSTNLASISSTNIKLFPIILPPESQRKEIINYISNTIDKINQQKSKIQQAIALLKEYRTALITNAVTGKIDVRQVPIP